MPDAVGLDEEGRENIGVDAGEGAISPVKKADVMPEPWEGEPDRIGALFQRHLFQDSNRWVEGDVLSQSDLHLRSVQEEALSEDLLPVRWPEIVDVDQGKLDLP